MGILEVKAADTGISLCWSDCHCLLSTTKANTLTFYPWHLTQWQLHRFLRTWMATHPGSVLIYAYCSQLLIMPCPLLKVSQFGKQVIWSFYQEVIVFVVLFYQHSSWYCKVT